MLQIKSPIESNHKLLDMQGDILLILCLVIWLL